MFVTLNFCVNLKCIKTIGLLGYIIVVNDDIHSRQIKLLADVNSDGKITAADSLEILRYSIRLSCSEKIGKGITA